MSAYTQHTQTAQVRPGFREEDIWRDALGGPESLHVFVVEGPMDAREWMPAGAMRSSKGGGFQQTAQRSGWYV